ncbi:hypothetical protein KFK09_029054 [Dendrobium nobile]|uniref:Uncharacterized protein n=1 Tax=Dendrobium nobile TaxID=94219 RepID=A0A8T3A4X4_DENNO|nr:hypothetical protein KFK09_029054 [Dendrobium nobile]
MGAGLRLGRERGTERGVGGGGEFSPGAPMPTETEREGVGMESWVIGGFGFTLELTNQRADPRREGVGANNAPRLRSGIIRLFCSSRLLPSPKLLRPSAPANTLKKSCYTASIKSHSNPLLLRGLT